MGKLSLFEQSWLPAVSNQLSDRRERRGIDDAVKLQRLEVTCAHTAVLLIGKPDEYRWAVFTIQRNRNHFDAHVPWRVPQMNRSARHLQHARLLSQPFSGDQLTLSYVRYDLTRVTRQVALHGSFDHAARGRNCHCCHISEPFGSARHFTVGPAI